MEQTPTNNDTQKSLGKFGIGAAFGILIAHGLVQVNQFIGNPVEFRPNQLIGEVVVTAVGGATGVATVAARRYLESATRSSRR